MKKSSARNTSGSQVPSLMVALKRIFEHTAGHTGKPFFMELVRQLAEVLQVHGVWVTEYLESSQELNALAFWLDGRYVETYRYAIAGTPCARVLEMDTICHIPDRVIELYPDDPDLPPLGAVSYMGIALKDTEGRVLGHLALLDRKPMKEIPEVYVLFQLFASRAAAELRRIRDEGRLRQREAMISRLLNGMMDGILECNAELRITQANEAALRAMRADYAFVTGKYIGDFLTEQGLSKLKQAMAFADPDQIRQGAHWIQGHLECRNALGEIFPADATVAGYRYEGQVFYALYFRNVQDRLRDEEQIRKLTVETTMLREKVSGFLMHEMLGSSEPIRQVHVQITQVAATDSTVLILGETGTGKELVAREIYRRSLRNDKPFVALNCAALPAELIESELFGHVKGAFTGAIQARDGRFLLADQGTIFLDEIGELPLALQAKLLRVLQQGEFEPVGSSITRKVNVRVIAATHRDLRKEVETGRFREDLFYRLHVFPIEVPPLRERGEDIILLAEAFLDKYAEQYGRKLAPLSRAHRQILLGYAWPGNVRELQNVMERAVITAQNGSLRFTGIDSNRQEIHPLAEETRVFTVAELEELEKRNILKALEYTRGRVSGKSGAAVLLGMPSTTLSSKMRKFGITVNKFENR